MKKAVIFIAWVLTTAVGITLFNLVSNILYDNFLWIAFWGPLSAFLFMPLGMLLGCGQWLILRKVAGVTGWFIPLTGIWPILFWLGLDSYYGELFIIMLFAGAFLGFCQWLVLQSKFDRAYWWILATALGWACGSTIAFTNTIFTTSSDNLEFFVLGVILGLTTGITLVLLPVRQLETDNSSQIPAGPS
jgi:hypothetical protein